MTTRELHHTHQQHEVSHLNTGFLLLIAGLGTFWTGVAYLLF
ncbi:MAG: hypothetical protein ACRYGK_17755 [Janthinobacterium lividum]